MDAVIQAAYLLLLPYLRERYSVINVTRLRILLKPHRPEKLCRYDSLTFELKLP